jgi:HPt (histidine-containing phosphotransfer) domain-containing protein
MNSEGNSRDVDTPNQKGADVFDLSQTMEMVGGDDALFREICLLLLQNSKEAIATIEEKISDGDAQGLERAAHSLKGSVANFGAKSAYDAAYRLEVLGREKKLIDAGVALSLLRSELARLETAIERAMGEPGK